MKYTQLFFLIPLLAQQIKMSASIADFVAQAVGTDEINDALFLTKALQSNHHPEANIGYAVLLNSNYFNKNKNALDTALAKVAVVTPTPEPSSAAAQPTNLLEQIRAGKTLKKATPIQKPITKEPLLKVPEHLKAGLAHIRQATADEATEGPEETWNT